MNNMNKKKLKNLILYFISFAILYTFISCSGAHVAGGKHDHFEAIGKGFVEIGEGIKENLEKPETWEKMSEAVGDYYKAKGEQEERNRAYKRKQARIKEYYRKENEIGKKQQEHYNRTGKWLPRDSFRSGKVNSSNKSYSNSSSRKSYANSSSRKSYANSSNSKGASGSVSGGIIAGKDRDKEKRRIEQIKRKQKTFYFLTDVYIKYPRYWKNSGALLTVYNRKEETRLRDLVKTNMENLLRKDCRLNKGNLSKVHFNEVIIQTLPTHVKNLDLRDYTTGKAQGVCKIHMNYYQYNRWRHGVGRIAGSRIWGKLPAEWIKLDHGRKP